MPSRWREAWPALQVWMGGPEPGLQTTASANVGSRGCRLSMRQAALCSTPMRRHRAHFRGSGCGGGEDPVLCWRCPLPQQDARHRWAHDRCAGLQKGRPRSAILMTLNPFKGWPLTLPTPSCSPCGTPILRAARRRDLDPRGCAGTAFPGPAAALGQRGSRGTYQLRQQQAILVPGSAARR